MKISYMMVMAAAVLLLAGCRREDVREVTLEVPGMNATNDVAIANALGFYEGVDRRTIKFDKAKKTVTLKYDSMKVALTNLRMAIEDKGIEVVFPQKSTGMAGFINER